MDAAGTENTGQIRPVILDIAQRQALPSVGDDLNSSVNGQLNIQTQSFLRLPIVCSSLWNVDRS